MHLVYTLLKYFYFEVAISLTIYRGHLGLSAQSLKKGLAKGSWDLSAPGAPKVRKKSTTELKT